MSFGVGQWLWRSWESSRLRQQRERLQNVYTEVYIAEKKKTEMFHFQNVIEIFDDDSENNLKLTTAWVSNFFRAALHKNWRQNCADFLPPKRLVKSLVRIRL